jgi:hypothetical protein
LKKDAQISSMYANDVNYMIITKISESTAKISAREEQL